MELRSESASCLSNTQGHHMLLSSKGGHVDGSSVKMSSPPCSGTLPAGIPEELDEMISKGPLFVNEFCAEGPTKEVLAARLDDVTQASSSEKDGVEGSSVSQVHEKCDHGLDKDLDMLDSQEPMSGWKNEMEAGEHVPSWMAGGKISIAASVTERTRNRDNFAANHNVPERTMPSSRRRTFFMVRMPRAADSELRSKIRLAELQLEEASKTRDVIRAALQLRRASKIGLLDKLKVVRDKERVCKDELQKKRLEIDPLQTALNRLKLADTKYRDDEIFSEEDLDNKIARLQHRIQHESIPLKEEKQLIREIKKLESQRSQVCANDAEHAHLLENYGPREEIQEQLDLLYRELDVLRVNQNQARLECKPIEKDLEDLNVKLDELVDQLEAAKRSQASVLVACKELKKSLNEQNAEFYKYRDNSRKAKELASFKNVEDVAVLCNEQVERMFKCWNNDSSFRERYIKDNVHSTLRRLETLDGRSLGMDEEPILLMSDTEHASESHPKDMELGSKKVGLRKEVVAKNPSATSVQGNNFKGLQGEKAQKPQEKIREGISSSVSKKKEVIEPKKSGVKLAQSSLKVSPPSSLASASAVSTSPSPLASAPAVPTSPAPVEDAAAKEAQAAEVKEKRRREEIGKAKEAAERKRRQAERAQAKAQLWAQKEAERRDKERVKKAKKKAAVGIEDVKTAETSAEEEKRKEVGGEDVSKVSVKRSPIEERGFMGKQLKSQRQPVLSPHSAKNMWQFPSTWLWVLLVILVTSLASIFVARL